MEGLLRIWNTDAIIAESTPDAIPLRLGWRGDTAEYAEVGSAERVVVQVAHAVAGKGQVHVYSATMGNAANTDANWVLEGTITDETPLEITTPCALVKCIAEDVDGSNVISGTNYLRVRISEYC